MSRPRHFVLAAGGTGGHMVPAAALAAELIGRGHRVVDAEQRAVRVPPERDQPLFERRVIGRDADQPYIIERVARELDEAAVDRPPPFTRALDGGDDLRGIVREAARGCAPAIDH